ncbi:MAG: pentapeptide repeat-containing protein [Cyanobacteria bacterium P01_F01_bin.13]
MAQQIMDAQNSIVLVPRMRSVRLAFRRLVAWSLELGLVAMGAAVPWGLGQYVLMTQENAPIQPIQTVEETTDTPFGWSESHSPVALNPLVQQAQKGWARMAQIPPHQLHRTVPRLTNTLWTIALIMPVIIAGGQLVQLSLTGQSWPKRWLRIRVISTAGGQLRPHQMLGRELMRWGMPLGIVGGITIATGLSLGPWTPVAIGLLAIAEGITVLGPGKQSWHDRIANTQVVIAMGEPLPILSLRYSLPFNETASHDFKPAVQLYGETADDDWWLTQAEGNLTSLVLAPRTVEARQREGNRLLASPVSSQPWLLLISGMAIACAVGIGIGRITLSSANGQLEEDAFLQTAKTLSTNTQSGGDYSAAILMLAQVDDPRTAHYLTDLLSQTSQPEKLATIQQALVSHGLDSLPPLLALARVLESELQQPLTANARHVLLEQRHIVQGAISKLLTIHSNELVGARLDRVNLSRYRDQDRAFRLIQPGLLAAGSSWQGANLSQANLADASFFNVGADGKPDSYDDIISDLSGITLVAASLEKANLQGAQLTKANLRDADLRDANLTYGNLERATLTNANLIHINASQSHWQGSNLVGADLTQAIFNGANLTQARLNRIEAAHSSWIKAILPQSDWVGANLIGADFSQANLTRANFQSANLGSVNFKRADLSQANLRDTDLSQTILAGVNLTDADLAGAIFFDGNSVDDSFIIPNAQLSAANHLRGVNFGRVRNLDGRQLNYICAQGGIHPTCNEGPGKD